MLLGIVEADNKIIAALNKMLHYKNFEKQNLAFDAGSFEKRIQNLIVLNDTLNNQNQKLIQENKSHRSKLRRHTLWFILLFIMVIIPSVILARNYLKK
jgi:hypothetical protein